MQKNENNYAFIDTQNVYLAIRELGWKIDWHRFRIYLKEKYHVQKAFLFIGYIQKNYLLYEAFRKAGFLCIFKPTIMTIHTPLKGNCDAELVLHAMIQYPCYDRAVIITGDGDFHCLIQYLLKKNKLKKLLIPNQKKYSALLKHFPSEFFGFLTDLRSHLEYKKRTPQGQNLKGRFSS